MFGFNKFYDLKGAGLTRTNFFGLTLCLFEAFQVQNQKSLQKAILLKGADAYKA